MTGWINIYISDKDVTDQLKAQGQSANEKQIDEVTNRICENIEKHDIKRELIGRAIKDIGIINLKKLG